MGQALAKNYERYAEQRKITIEHTFFKLRSYLSIVKNNNHNNNDDYDYILDNKINSLRSYLDRNTSEKVMNEGANTMNEKKYTVKEVSEMLNVSTRTIENYISAGKLKIEWGKGRTGRIRLITTESINEMKENERMKYEEGYVTDEVMNETPVEVVLKEETVSKEEVQKMAIAVVERVIENKLIAVEEKFNNKIDIVIEQNKELILLNHAREKEIAELKELQVKDRSRIDDYIINEREKRKEWDSMPWYEKVFKKKNRPY